MMSKGGREEGLEAKVLVDVVSALKVGGEVEAFATQLPITKKKYLPVGRMDLSLVEAINPNSILAVLDICKGYTGFI